MVRRTPWIERSRPVATKVDSMAESAPARVQGASIQDPCGNREMESRSRFVAWASRAQSHAREVVL